MKIKKESKEDNGKKINEVNEHNINLKTSNKNRCIK